MAIHKKREESGRAVARLILESRNPVELPPAQVDQKNITLERAEFQPFLTELTEVLEAGGLASPVPLVQSDSLFAVDGESRTFWLRLWHTDQTRTQIARVHIVNCIPQTGNVQLRLGG